jgi:3-methyl-2-oxobutanoate hydroxymethyltransferase
VCHDAFGLSGECSPPFVKRYAELGSLVSAAAGKYVEEVRTGAFPLPSQK